MSLPCLSFINHPCIKCSLSITNFLEEIASLSHSIVFLYFFALITEEVFLISPCYSLELCIQMGMSLLFSFAFCLSSSLNCLWGLLKQPFAFLHLFFLGWFWPLPLVKCYEPLSIVLQAFCLPDLISWFYSLPPPYNHKGINLGHTWMAKWFFLLSPI